MKSTPRLCRSVTLLGGAILLASGPAFAAEPAADTSSAPTMFMGLDLAVPRDDKTVPIVDVTDTHMMIASGDEMLRVPTSGRNFRLQMNHALKLSDGAATVTNLSIAPGYSPETDPYRKFAKSSGAEGGAGAVYDLASVGLRDGESAYSVNTAAINRAESMGFSAPGAESGRAGAQANIDAAYGRMGSAANSTSSDEYSTGTYARQLQEELADNNYDAVDVAFDVSSPTPLTTPWVAVLVKYRDRESPQEEPRTWIATKALAPIGSRPTKVRFKQVGLPVGYRVESTQIHLYNKGQEIATTVAPMRTVLTPEEAFQYRVSDYVRSHSDATLPAAPAAGQISDTLREHLTTRYAKNPVYVRVLPTGRAERAYADKGCKTPVDDAKLDSLLSLVRFDPALEKGKPVKGVVMLVSKPS